MKCCPKCKINKPLNDFGNNKKSKDGKQRYCKQCHAEYDHNNYVKYLMDHKKKRKQYQQDTSQWLKDYKKTLNCSKCKENRWYLLQFHHINPSEKGWNIGDLKKRSVSRILEEIKKCIVLCSNCHIEYHYIHKETGITTEQYINI